jgi:FkbM family methyltransferase
MSALARGVLDRFRTARTLFKGGATLRGIMLYPVRHRLPVRRHQIDLKTGLSMTAPLNEPLLHTFEDIWLNQCFTPYGFKIDAGDMVVDIGANIGVFSMWAATRAPRVQVISVEPSPRMFSVLLQNLSRNGLQQVLAVQAACGGIRGTAVLYSYGSDEGTALYPREIRGKLFRPLVRVEVLTLDDIFQQHHVEVCNLLKLNCEGGEYEIILKASEKTLQRVRKVSMIYHLGIPDHGPEEMANFLEGQGFEVLCNPPYDDLGGYLYARRRSN